MQIYDHLEQPAYKSLDGFITRLTDSKEQVEQNLRLYVLSEPVQKDLDQAFRDFGAKLGNRQDVGRFIYGSFGSGKSHLLTVLGRMLERDPQVYALGDSGLSTLRDTHPWLNEQKLLVVRINMMGQDSLASALYKGYNEALPAQVTPLSFTDEDEVFKLVELDAVRMGGLDKLLLEAGIPSVKNYQQRKEGDLRTRLELAALLLTWRNHGKALRSDDIYVPMREGLERVARHAQEQGYTGIAWLVDELVIWIRAFPGEQYIRQINDLSAMVDHDAHRVLPFLVLLGVQTDVAQTCPEDISEKGFRDHLSFVSDRFRPWIRLEEQDLYEVAARRVLRRKQGDPQVPELERLIDQTLERHSKLVRELSGGVPPELVRRLYPFHPALLRVLMDLTQALSRSRSAMAVLYGLLEAYRGLEVGEFIPVHALWDFLFSSEQVQGLRSNARSVLSQRMASTAELYVSLDAKIDGLPETGTAGVAAGSNSSVGAKAGTLLHPLKALVRAVLLCQLSERPYFPDGRSLKDNLTASTMYQLNMQTLKATVERTAVSKVSRQLRTLSGVAPQVEVSGDVDPSIRIVVEQVNIEQVLQKARGEVRHADRFAYMRRLLDAQLGLELNQLQHSERTITWRGTRRRVRIRLENVRQLSYAGQQNDFESVDSDVLILVDYPFDEDPSKGRDEDLEMAQKARARRRQWTVAWLPEHLKDTEKLTLMNATAVELVRRDKREYLKDFNQRDAEEVARSLESFQVSRRSELEEAIRHRYFHHPGQGQGGLLYALDPSLDSLNLEHMDPSRAIEWLASRVLEARYPNHPQFERRVGWPELNAIAPGVVKALVSGQAVEVRGPEMNLMKAIAVPLELVYGGENGVTPRTDGRYMKRIQEWYAGRERFRAGELRAFLQGEGREGLGFSPEVASFFLAILLQAEGFAGLTGGKAVEAEGIERLPTDFELVRDQVVDAPSWDRARKGVRELLSIDKVSELPSSPAQSRLLRSVDEALARGLPDLSTYLNRLEGVLKWTGLLPEDSERLLQGRQLQEWLLQVKGGGKAAERIRTLAGLGEQGGLSAVATLRTHLGTEATALERLEQKRNAMDYIQKHGAERERVQHLDRLRAMLRSGVQAGLLSISVDAWCRATDALFSDILNRTDVLAADVWQQAQHTGQRLWGMVTPLGAATRATQTHFAQEAGQRAQTQCAQARTLIPLLEELCTQVGLPSELSPRVQALHALVHTLSSLHSLDEGERLRRLAALAGSPELETLEETIRASDDELKALRQLLAHREALAWIQAHAPEEGQKQLIEPIREVLRLPTFAQRLIASLGTWEQAIRALHVVKPGTRSAERRSISRQKVREEALLAVEELLNAVDGERFTLRIVLQRQG